MAGIRSERRLCDEVHLNLAYRWICRGGKAPLPGRRAFQTIRPAAKDDGTALPRREGRR
jgi:transposase